VKGANHANDKFVARRARNRIPLAGEGVLGGIVQPDFAWFDHVFDESDFALLPQAPATWGMGAPEAWAHLGHGQALLCEARHVQTSRASQGSSLLLGKGLQ